MNESPYKCEFWDVEIRDDGWAIFSTFRVPKEFSKRKEALKELERIETELAKEGVKGWIVGTPIENYPMIKLFDGLGAQEYHCTGEELVFYKEVGNVKHDAGNKRST